MTFISTEQDLRQKVTTIFERFRKVFQESPALSLHYRLNKLDQLEKILLKDKNKIAEAVWNDFGKSQFESDTSEILTSLVELRKAKRELHKWIRPVTISTPLELTGTKHFIRYEPKGVVLIISPWNYPVNLTLIPMIAAWAAGNRIIVKPSEFTPHTSDILSKIIEQVFSENEIVVVNGNAEVASELVQLPFNHIFFTGSAPTARKILIAAAKNLTPVTLELGGKSPVIIDTENDISSWVKDIAYAKCLNAGQTCVAPDFIVLPEYLQSEFVKLWQSTIQSFYGNHILENPDYCGIIHEKHYTRLMNIIQNSLDEGAALSETIECDPHQRKIKPVLLLNSNWDHASMQEEIFGPVFPVIGYKDISEVITALHQMNRPLTLYLFSKNKKQINRMLDEIRSGGVTINNCLLNYCNFNLPFGGDHQSGHGANHGKSGFETFSHRRAVSRQGRFLNPLRIFYPPFTQRKFNIKNIALKILGKV